MNLTALVPTDTPTLLIMLANICVAMVLVHLVLRKRTH
jgi:hypothetical protein